AGPHPLEHLETSGCSDQATADQPVVGGCSADDDLDPLELFDLGITGGRHRLAQGTRQVHGAVWDRGRAKQDVLQIPDRCEFGPLAAWQLLMPSFWSPMETATGRLLGPG